MDQKIHQYRNQSQNSHKRREESSLLPRYPRNLQESYYEAHIKGDPFAGLRMAEVEEDDALEFINRLSVKKKADGQPLGVPGPLLGLSYSSVWLSRPIKKTRPLD
jgi:hypothetical protein